MPINLFAVTGVLTGGSLLGAGWLIREKVGSIVLDEPITPGMEGGESDGYVHGTVRVPDGLQNGRGALLSTDGVAAHKWRAIPNGNASNESVGTHETRAFVLETEAKDALVTDSTWGYLMPESDMEEIVESETVPEPAVEFLGTYDATGKFADGGTFKESAISDGDSVNVAGELVKVSDADLSEEHEAFCEENGIEYVVDSLLLTNHSADSKTLNRYLNYAPLLIMGAGGFTLLRALALFL